MEPTLRNACKCHLNNNKRERIDLICKSLSVLKYELKQAVSVKAATEQIFLLEQVRIRIGRHIKSENL